LFKVNWDAAVDKKLGQIGYGLIVRDHEGAVLAAWSTTENYLATPEVAKALATLHTVETSKEMGFHDIILEGHALLVTL
jgi:ribonuclease HI